MWAVDLGVFMTAGLRISSENCSVGKALAVVGERWSLLIVREAFDGVRVTSTWPILQGPRSSRGTWLATSPSA